jgi:uncharacterized protein (TIGR00369 family)
MPASIFDRLKMPPVAALLGWRLLDINLEDKWIKVAFDGKPEFINPTGSVQGGILSAMLDDAMGPIVVAVTNAEGFPTTIDLNVSFIRPVKPGPISVTAQITNLGRQLVFLEGKLFDLDGKLCARAIASSLLKRIDAKEVFSAV